MALQEVTRTVLKTSITSASTYSSGPLDVGDLHELIVDCHATAITYTSGSLGLNVSRIDAYGNLINVGYVDFSAGVAAQYGVEIAPALANIGGQRINSSPSLFGDQIQLDLVASAGNSVSTTISVKGK